MPVSLPADFPSVGPADGFHGAPAKFVLCVAGSLLALVLNQWPPLLFLAAVSTVAAGLKLDRRLLARIYLLLILALIVCLAGAAWLPRIGAPPRPGMPAATLRMAVLPALRLLVNLNLTLCLVLSTPSGALTRLIAALPLPDWLFIPLAVALRFIASFLHELSAVKEALLLRERRGLGKIAWTRPLALWRGLLVPATFRALAGADELAMAVEMKGIGRRQLHWRRPPLLAAGDGRALLLGAVVLAVCLAWQHGWKILPL